MHSYKATMQWEANQVQTEPMHQDQKKIYESLQPVTQPEAAEWWGMQMLYWYPQARCLPLHWWSGHLEMMMASRPGVAASEVMRGPDALHLQTRHGVNTVCWALLTSKVPSML